MLAIATPRTPKCVGHSSMIAGDRDLDRFSHLGATKPRLTREARRTGNHFVFQALNQGRHKRTRRARHQGYP